jgi:hypothetical protein
MCLISVCPKGTKKGTEEVYKFIKSGMDSNTSGSGYMFKRDGDNKITIRKGFFNYGALIESLKSENLNDNDELVVHHRIPTSGNKNDLNCHPFVVSDIHEEVIMTNGSTEKPCMAHNGIFSRIIHFENLNPDFSDTYAFTRYIMGNPRMYEIFTSDYHLFETLTSHIVGTDKLVFLFPDKDLKMIGNYIEDNGYFHSNTGYKRYTYDRGGSSSHNYATTSYNSFSEGFGSYDEYDTEDEYGWPPALPAIKVKEKVSGYITIPNLLTFDSSEIGINENNYNHFDYVMKAKWNDTAPNERYKIKLSSLEGFDGNALLQVLTWVSEDKKSYGTAVQTFSLMENYYYIPKKQYYDVYKDYKRLLLNDYQYSKSSIKDLGKLLSRNYMKPDNHPTLFKKDRKFYCLKALKMLHDNLTNPMKEVIDALNSGTA